MSSLYSGVSSISFRLNHTDMDTPEDWVAKLYHLLTKERKEKEWGKEGKRNTPNRPGWCRSRGYLQACFFFWISAPVLRPHWGRSHSCRRTASVSAPGWPAVVSPQDQGQPGWGKGGQRPCGERPGRVEPRAGAEGSDGAEIQQVLERKSPGRFLVQTKV